MNSPPPPPPPAGHRAFRDLMPSILVEIVWATLVWAAYLCRRFLGFDPLFLFHRGGPGSAKEYLWIAVGFTVLAAWLAGWKYRRARILHSRGIETVGTIVGTSRRYRNIGWDATVKYPAGGKDITRVFFCDTKTRPTEKTAVPVVYDPQRPERAWVGFTLPKRK